MLKDEKTVKYFCSNFIPKSHCATFTTFSTIFVHSAISSLPAGLRFRDWFAFAFSVTNLKLKYHAENFQISPMDITIIQIIFCTLKQKCVPKCVGIQCCPIHIHHFLRNLGPKCNIFPPYRVACALRRDQLQLNSPGIQIQRKLMLSTKTSASCNMIPNAISNKLLYVIMLILRQMAMN